MNAASIVMIIFIIVFIIRTGLHLNSSDWEGSPIKGCKINILVNQEATIECGGTIRVFITHLINSH